MTITQTCSWDFKEGAYYRHNGAEGDTPRRYRQGKKLGDGFSAAVYELVAADGQPKAVKIPIRNNKLDNEYLILQRLPVSLGLQRPPKGFTAGRLIVGQYDGDLKTLFPLTAAQKADAVRQLVTGLTCLHDARITHNDINIKGNIMYRERHGQRRYDLIDFGAATAWEASEDRSAKILLRRSHDIVNLGKALVAILFDGAYPSVSVDALAQRALPGHYADLLNAMLSGRYCSLHDFEAAAAIVAATPSSTDER